MRTRGKEIELQLSDSVFAYITVDRDISGKTFEIDSVQILAWVNEIEVNIEETKNPIAFAWFKELAIEKLQESFFQERVG